MWRDICLSNRDAILAMMQRYQNELDTLKQAIETEDEDTLLKIFTRSKKARDGYIEN